MDTPAETPTRILEAIHAAERPKKWVAEKSGIPLTTLTRKLNGHGEFTVGEIARIAAALTVSPASLLPDDFAVAVAS